MDNLQRTYWGSNTNLHVAYEGSHLIDENSQHKEERSIFPCCDSNLNFSTANCSEDDLEYGNFKRNKNTRQDPMSHRIIEKRRRDRMNNCLADLSRLIPTEYLKKGRGRIEKTEIIEMAIKHMKFLQQDSDPSEQFRLGYQECMSETMRFMVEVEGHFSNEAICVRLLTHLQKHCANLPHRSSHVPQTTTVTDRLMGPGPTVVDRSPIQVPEFQTMKVEIEQNNNNAKENNTFNNNNTYSNGTNNDENEHGNTENGRISYKYKTNIKLRFNQDLNGESEAKRPKLDGDRRSSVNSIENRSMSHSSPASEACTRNSDAENTNRTSPSDSTLSSNNQLKLESACSNETTNPCSPHEPSLHSLNMKNFKVPIFMLHTKGSFYVPLTVDYKALMPYFPSYEISDEVILHPVTINVNFQPAFNNSLEGSKYKCDYPRTTWQ